MIEESTTRSPSIPRTEPLGFTTAVGSFSEPILHVPHGWYAVSAFALRNSSIAESLVTSAPGKTAREMYISF